MVRNWPLEVFKVFFKQNSIFTLLLNKVWKSKKSIFCDFFTCGSPKNVSIEYSTGLEITIEISEGLQNGQNSSRLHLSALGRRKSARNHIL